MSEHIQRKVVVITGSGSLIDGGVMAAHRYGDLTEVPLQE